MQATKSKQTQEFQRMSNDKFISEVVGVGDLLRRNQVSTNKGNDNAPNVKRVDEAYRQFTEELKDQREFMKTASDDQKEVFREVIEEFMKLRKDGNFDFERSNKEFQAAVARINEVDGSGAAKARIEHIAALGMQHTDQLKPKAGVISQEIQHRMSKFFEPSKSDLESPLFRRLAGMDRGNNHRNMITPLREMQNLGQAEAVKSRLSGDIMGPDEHESPNHMANVAATMAGKHNVTFPSKIENLHVDRLIVRMVEKEKEATIAPHPALGDGGRSAVAVGNPMLPPPSGIGASVAHSPMLPAPSAAHVDPKHLTHQEGDYLPTMEVLPREPQTGLARVKPSVRARKFDINDAEDVEFRDHEHPTHRAEFHALPAPKHDVAPAPVASAPIQIKGNPHNPLRTQETALSSAVRGAIGGGFALPIAQTPTVVDAFKTKDDSLVDNDVGVRSADATRKFEEDASGEAAGAGGGLLPDLLSLVPEVFGGKPKGPKEKAKVGEEKPKTGEEKPKTGEEKAKVEGKGAKAAEGLEGEGRGLAKGISKVSKTLGHAGKALGIAGTAITAYNAYNEYEDADAKLKKGEITAQQAKEAKANAVGGGVGATIGGWIGGTIGAVAGSVVPVAGTLAGGAAGGYLGAEAGEWLGKKAAGLWSSSDAPDTGKTVAQISQQHAEAKGQATNQTVVVQAPAQSVGPSTSTTNYVPISGSPRQRESYFDRAMLGTFVP